MYTNATSYTSTLDEGARSRVREAKNMSPMGEVLHFAVARNNQQSSSSIEKAHSHNSNARKMCLFRHYPAARLCRRFTWSLRLLGAHPHHLCVVCVCPMSARATKRRYKHTYSHIQSLGHETQVHGSVVYATRWHIVVILVDVVAVVRINATTHTSEPPHVGATCLPPRKWRLLLRTRTNKQRIYATSNATRCVSCRARVLGFCHFCLVFFMRAPALTSCTDSDSYMTRVSYDLIPRTRTLDRKACTGVRVLIVYDASTKPFNEQFENKLK